MYEVQSADLHMSRPLMQYCKKEIRYITCYKKSVTRNCYRDFIILLHYSFLDFDITFTKYN